MHPKQEIQIRVYFHTKSSYAFLEGWVLGLGRKDVGGFGVLSWIDIRA